MTGDGAAPAATTVWVSTARENDVPRAPLGSRDGMPGPVPPLDQGGWVAGSRPRPAPRSGPADSSSGGGDMPGRRGGQV